jgi:hypothetical protein
MEVRGMTLDEQGGVQEFRPGFGVGFDGVGVGLGIQTRAMLELMEEDAGGVFGSIDHDGVFTARIRITAIDVLGLYRLYWLYWLYRLYRLVGWDRWGLSERRMCEKVHGDVGFGRKQTEDPAPQVPREVITLLGREIGDKGAMGTGGVDRCMLEGLSAEIEGVKVGWRVGLLFDPLAF